MTKVKESQETMDTFKGWENAEDVEFFGDKPEATNDVDKIIEAVEKTDLSEGTVEKTKEEKKAEATTKTKKEEETEDISFFETDENEEEISTEPTTTSKKEKEGTTKVDLSKTAMVEYLKDKGIVEYELEEGAELTDELAEEILEDSFDDGVESRVGELMKDLPETVKNMVNLAVNGGDVDKFISSLTNTPTVKITDDLDMADEANQELVVRTIKQSEGEDKETTDAYIDFLKDSGKLQSVSEKSKDKIVAANKKIVADQVKQSKAAKENAKSKQRAFKSELTTYVDSLESISSFTVNKKDKLNLPSYIADRNITLEDGRQTTALQRDLLTALQDKEKTVLLAKILKSDFDFSEITKAEKTKYTKEIQRGLSRSNKANTTNTGSSRKSGSLADYF